MAYLDGTEYLALDDEAVQTDGDADGQQPACTSSVQTIRSNSQMLGDQGSRVTFAQASARAGTQSASSIESGIRPHTSWELTSYFSIPWVCSRGFEGVDLSLNARITSEDGDAGDGVYGRIRLMGLEDGDQTILDSTYDTTELIDNFQQVDFSLDLDEPLRRRLVTDLVLEFRGLVQGAVVTDTVAIDGRSQLRLDGGATSIYDYSLGLGTVPDAGDPGVMISVDSPSGASNDDQAGTYFEHMRCVDDSIMHTLPSRGTGMRGEYPDIDVYHMSYIQPRSVEIVDRYANVLTAEKDRYRAERVVRATDDVQLVSGVVEQFRRPRCLWVGPAGQPTGGEEREAPPHYHERFVRVRGDVTDEPALKSMCRIQTEDPTLALMLNTLPIHVALNYQFAGTTEDLFDAATVGNWTLDLEVEKFSGGTWSSIGSSSIDADVSHLFTHVSTDYPVLYAEWLRHRYLLRDAGTLEYVSGSWFVPREGQLWAKRLDHSLIQREQIEVQVDYDPSSPAPCRWSLTLNPNSFTYQDAPLAYRNQAKWLWYMITGASLWEFPGELS